MVIFVYLFIYAPVGQIDHNQDSNFDFQIFIFPQSRHRL